MQQLQKASVDVASHACAEALLDGVPPVMQFIRRVAHRNRAKGLSVQQFRTLGFLRRNSGASVSELAEHLGLALPSVSRLVDKLVIKKLLKRRRIPGNRRQLELTLSARGQSLLNGALSATVAELAMKLQRLPPLQRRNITNSLIELRRLFEPLARQNPSPPHRSS